MNDQVAGYRGLVESLAEHVAGTRRAKQVRAEYDDLVQEGLIQVWQSLGQGITPAREILRLRMLSYIRLLSRQTGNTIPGPDQVQHISYDQLLPMDDFRASGDS